jgi:RNA polymerase sigma-70 factor, ECF subfamily
MRRDDPCGGALRGRPGRSTLRTVEGDAELLARLRSGDEGAFVTLVNQYNGSLLRLARTYAPTTAVAEEAVQETWMGVIRGVDRFEGRSSFKTWLFRILINRATTAGAREQRTLPLDESEAAVDPSRFSPAGAWAEPLEGWESAADDRLVAGTWAAALRVALDDLPPRQREIVLLRDVEELSSEDVCALVGITEGNQRVLLHRGRSRLRTLLEHELTTRGR